MALGARRRRRDRARPPFAGGTSEIRRDIIGVRVLGLPRNRDTDCDVPVRDVPQKRPPR